MVLGAMLGGVFGSRLNLRLREELGYTYGARAGFDPRRAAGSVQRRRGRADRGDRRCADARWSSC